MSEITDYNMFGDHAAFEHIGIAVQSIEEVCPNLDKVEDPINNVTVAFLNINGMRVELVEPLNEASPVVEILKKGQSIYHTCYSVQNIQDSVDCARKHGFHLISKESPAMAFNNSNIVWLFHKTLGLVELVETPE